MKKIGIIMGSDSDLPVVEKAMTTLEFTYIPPIERRQKSKSLRKMPDQTDLAQLLQQQERQLIWQAPLQPAQPFLLSEFR